MLDKVLVLTGPTGVGKTKLSLYLAKKYNGEIISGDSIQVYKGMDILSAKIKENEKEGIPHHLIDCLEINEDCNVYMFQQMVRQKISEIVSRKHLPIIVGGTGLYLKASLYDYNFLETTDENTYSDLSDDEVYELLKEKDPIEANKLHPHNRKRVVRALNIIESSGKTKQEINDAQEHKLVYDALFICLTKDREELYDDINKRVDIMFEEGLLDEVTHLETLNPSRNARQAIGYKEFIPYFNHEISLEEVKEQIKKNTRKFAKRQFTFFRHQLPVKFFDKKDVEDIDKYISTWYSHE